MEAWGAFRATAARLAGGHMKFRTLGRDSAHRQALLRNLVTSLIKQESIKTTYAKAKEAQRLAEKLITLAKRNNETSRREAQGILFVWSTITSSLPLSHKTPSYPLMRGLRPWSLPLSLAYD